MREMELVRNVTLVGSIWPPEATIRNAAKEREVQISLQILSEVEEVGRWVSSQEWKKAELIVIDGAAPPSLSASLIEAIRLTRADHHVPVVILADQSSDKAPPYFTGIGATSFQVSSRLEPAVLEQLAKIFHYWLALNVSVTRAGPFGI